MCILEYRGNSPSWRHNQKALQTEFIVERSLGWNIANESPIFKKGRSKVIANHRPVFVPSIIYMIMETAVRETLLTHLKTQPLISKTVWLSWGWSIRSGHKLRFCSSMQGNVLIFMWKYGGTLFWRIHVSFFLLVLNMFGRRKNLE